MILAVPRIWIAELRISARTAEKIVTAHGIGVEELREAVVNVRGLEFVWHEHPERGHRAIVKAFIRQRKVLVVLYPADGPLGDCWNLGSAYFI